MVRRILALERIAILWSLTVQGTFRPALRQFCKTISNSAVLGRDVIGAATNPDLPNPIRQPPVESSILVPDGTEPRLRRSHRRAGPSSKFSYTESSGE